MNKNMIYTISAIALGTFAEPSASLAENYTAQKLQPKMAYVQQQNVQEDPLLQQIGYLQTEWARIKYQTPGKDRQIKALNQLENHAASVTSTYPDRAEPKIWQAIILSTDAGIAKGISALGKVKEAKALLEQALEIDEAALNGSAYTSLGSLYYQVPGWPIAFGNTEKAEEYLTKALKINPDGIDPNFFYADFLIEDDREQEARLFLEQALKAPDRLGRTLADAGRRQEIKAKLAEINETVKNGKARRYN